MPLTRGFGFKNRTAGIFPGQEVLKTNVDCGNQGYRIISDNLALPMDNEEEIIKDKSLPERSNGLKN